MKDKSEEIIKSTQEKLQIIIRHQGYQVPGHKRKSDKQATWSNTCCWLD